MFAKDYTFTKRHLGLLLLAIGILGFIAIIGIDVLDAGRQGGIGPAQRLGLGAMALLAIIGMTLIPLGNAPA
ncbi:MAG: hypothetical protein H7175_02625 [Burkholderiales bacterium]|nr:hypothetical protein [Anaerolineae bacterium]